MTTGQNTKMWIWQTKIETDCSQGKQYLPVTSTWGQQKATGTTATQGRRERGKNSSLLTGKAPLRMFQIYIWTFCLTLCYTKDTIMFRPCAEINHKHSSFKTLTSHSSHGWAADIATSAHSFMSHFLFTFLLKPYVSCRAFKWLCWQAKQENNKTPYTCLILWFH